MPAFADKLAQLLLRRGLSQRGFARQLADRKIDITQRAVSGWCSGSTPRPEYLAAIADFFSVPVDVLIDAKKELPPDPKREMHQILKEAPAAVQKGFLGPDVAWSHYMTMEVLFDAMLAERGGKIPSAEEQANFQESMRAFGRTRAKGRAALVAALKLAGDTGVFMLGHHLAVQNLSAALKK